MIILGLIVLIAAVVVGVAGVMTNLGDAHRLTDDFVAFGYHVTGSTGMLLLYGIVIGAVGMLGLSLLMAGARRTARRGRAARRDLEHTRAEAIPADHAPAEGRSWRHPLGHHHGTAATGH